MAPILVTSSLTRKNTLAILDKLATKEIVEISGSFLIKKYFKVEPDPQGGHKISYFVPDRGGIRTAEIYHVDVSEDSISPRLTLTRRWNFSQVISVVAILSLILAAPITIAYFLAQTGSIGWTYLPWAIAVGMVASALTGRALAKQLSECGKYLEAQLNGGAEK